jgi:hypothetical protein
LILFPLASSFNPVARTFLVKLLARIAKAECSGHPPPSKQALDKIADDSHGDIRTAIHSLQYQTLGSERVSGPGALGIGEDTVLLQGLAKDETLDLFHALGKILYTKRSIANTSETADIRESTEAAYGLLNSMPYVKRLPLRVNPEQVFESAHTDADTFNLFLGHNAPYFFSDIDEYGLACSYLSDADLLGGTWQHSSVMSTYVASVAIRGLLFSHTSVDASLSSGRRGAFRSLYKPEYLTMARITRENKVAVSDMYERLICAQAADLSGGQLLGKKDAAADHVSCK